MKKVLIVLVVGFLSSLVTQTTNACGLFHCWCHHHHDVAASGGGGRDGAAVEQGARELKDGTDVGEARSIDSREIGTLLAAANLILNTLGPKSATAPPVAAAPAAPGPGAPPPAGSLTARIGQLEAHNADIDKALVGLTEANKLLLQKLTAIEAAVGVK